MPLKEMKILNFFIIFTIVVVEGYIIAIILGDKGFIYGGIVILVITVSIVIWKRIQMNNKMVTKRKQVKSNEDHQSFSSVINKENSLNQVKISEMTNNNIEKTNKDIITANVDGKTVINEDGSIYKTIQDERNNAYKEAIEELNNIIGLKALKNEIERFIANIIMMKQKEKHGMKKQEQGSLHMVFAGPPGTGKTTVARIMAKLLHGLGYLSTGQCIEVDREDLIAGYVGQTAEKTKAVIERALGGVLFIDEAYSLTPNNSQGFEQEAIDTLIKLMEDYRNDLVIIFAGYENEIKKFLKSNPGFESRVPYKFKFSPYCLGELAAIGFQILIDKGYDIAPSVCNIVEDVLSSWMDRAKNENGRLVRNFIERIEREQNFRLYKQGNGTLSEIIIDDVLAAKEEMEKNVL